MKQKILAILLQLLLLPLFLALVACGPDQAPGTGRIYAVKDLPQASTQFTFNKSLIWPEATTGACARLSALVRERSHKRSRFAFLGRPFTYSVNDDGSVYAVGGIDLAKSPLIQFVLTTPAVQEKIGPVLSSTDEEFLRLVKERLRIDACQAESPRTQECEDNLQRWAGALAKARQGTLYQEKTEAVTRELKAKIPGVYGGVTQMKTGKDGSLFLSLLERVGLFREEESRIDPVDAEAILTAEVPLFPYSRNWRDWLADAVTSVPAAIAGISKQPNKEERLCSLVLWQRMFAQLLMIKGYEGPKLTSDGYLAQFEPGATGLEKVKVEGGYLELATGKPVALEPDEIPKYDPAMPGQKYLEGSALTPLPRAPVRPVAGSLSDTLDRLEAYSWIFAATSPGAWSADTPYFFGDLVESETAIAPFQTHTLALGLIVMGLRNFGHRHFLAVDTETDTALPDSTGATGMVVLANGKENAAFGEMRLYDVIRLTNVLVRAADTLDKIYEFAATNQKLLEKRSLVYSKDAKDGAPFYTPEKLKELETLRATLLRLMYPAAHRMIRMTEYSSGCAAVETANYRAGGIRTQRTVERCSPELVRDYKATMRALAHYTGSKVYYRKSL